MFRSSRVDAFGEVRPDCPAQCDCCRPRCAVGSVHSTSLWDPYQVHGCGWEKAQAQSDHPALARGTGCTALQRQCLGSYPLTCRSWRLTFEVPHHHTWWLLVPGCWCTIKLAFGKAPSWAALNKQLPAPLPSRRPRRGTEQEVAPPLQKLRRLADSGLCSQGLRAFLKVHISRPCSCTWRASVGSGSLTAQRFPE